VGAIHYIKIVHYGGKLMFNNDPNTWTADFVRRNAADCIQFLKEAHMTVIKLTRDGNYQPVVAGIDRIINGFITMHNAGVGNYMPHMATLSLLESQIVAFGVTEAPENRRIKTALNLMRDAYDFASTDTFKGAIKDCIEIFESGMDIDDIMDEVEPGFPEQTLELLEDLTVQYK
jgi:hypothetical protein